jgi:hypothetical protein
MHSGPCNTRGRTGCRRATRGAVLSTSLDALGDGETLKARGLAYNSSPAMFLLSFAIASSELEAESAAA